MRYLLRMFVCIFLSLACAQEFTKALQVETFKGGSRTVSATLQLPKTLINKQFTIVDTNGKVRPYQTYSTQGSQQKIYFMGRSDEKLTAKWYSSSSKKATFRLPESGLLLSTKKYNGQAVTSLEEFNELWSQAAMEDRSFVSQVFQSFNPHGPNSKTMSRFDGYIAIKEEGTYTFSIASQDASFLEINGKLITQWPGNHDIHGGLKGERSGKIKLKKGIHRFRYSNATGNSKYIMLAAIGEGKNRQIIPQDQFTATAYAFIGPLNKGNKKVADFVYENQYLLTIGAQNMMIYQFDAPKLQFGDQYVWTLPNGKTLNGRRIKYPFFEEGTYSIKLSILDKKQRIIGECEQELVVLPKYGQDQRNENQAKQAITTAMQLLKRDVLPPVAYRYLYEANQYFLLDQAKAQVAQLAVAHKIATKKEAAYTFYYKAALDVQQINEQYELAEACFLSAMQNAPNIQTKNLTRLHYGGMLNLCLNRPLDAKEVLQQIKATELPSEWDRRLLKIYLADTVLVLENYAAAEKAFQAIPPTTNLITENGLNREALFDYNSRYFRVKNLVAQGHYQDSLREMDLLEWYIPEDRLSPALNLIKADALIGNQQPKKAAVCLQRALLAQVDQHYKPQLRLKLADVYMLIGRWVKAKHQLRMIRRESPYSREELEIGSRMKEIDQKLLEVNK
ncbi:MAG: PA14 domain-containing protein [Lentisphaeria bacterium]|nr:PA14 domain-containing protein [Lentisphaeria bacterium]